MNKNTCMHLPEVLNFFAEFFPEFYCRNILFNKEFVFFKQKYDSQEIFRLKHTILYDYLLVCDSEEVNVENFKVISQILKCNKTFYLVFKNEFLNKIHLETHLKSLQLPINDIKRLVNVPISNMLNILDRVSVVLAYCPMSTNKNLINLLKEYLFEILKFLYVSTEKIKTIKVLIQFLDNLDISRFSSDELNKLNRYYINLLVQTQKCFQKLIDLASDALRAC